MLEAEAQTEKTPPINWISSWSGLFLTQFKNISRGEQAPDETDGIWVLTESVCTEV